MTTISLGKKTVTTAGTPIQLTPTSTNNAVNRIYIQPDPANTGLVYIGTASMVRATRVNVWRVLGKPSTTGPIDSWDLVSNDAQGNAFDATSFWVDADVNGEGVIATLQQA